VISRCSRLHVDRLRMDAFPDGDGLRVRWGVDVKDTIINGGRVKIPAEKKVSFEEFISLALANRTPDQVSVRFWCARI